MTLAPYSVPYTFQEWQNNPALLVSHPNFVFPAKKPMFWAQIIK